MINYKKSALTFRPSTSVQTIEDIKRVISDEVVKGHAMYLGLPNFSLRSKKLQFSYLRNIYVRKFKVGVPNHIRRVVEVCL